MSQQQGLVGHKHISSYHRFFSRARWTTDEVGLTLAALSIQRLATQGVIRLVVDDTLGRHTGKCIAATSMHRDPLLSTGRRPFFHWGHVWVVLAIEVTLFDKSWALPVLFRLHRREKRCKAEKKQFQKLTEQAQELVELLAKRYLERRPAHSRRTTSHPLLVHPQGGHDLQRYAGDADRRPEKTVAPLGRLRR